MIDVGFLLSPRLRRHYALAQLRLTIPARDASDWAQRQLEAFRSVWADARADVPYYGDLVARGLAPAEIATWNDVRSIPELTRSALQGCPDRFIRRSGPPTNYAVTGGSTGVPVQVGVQQHERDLLRMVKLASWIDAGYTKASRLFLLWGHAHLLGTGLKGRVNHLRRVAADRLLGYRRVDVHWLSSERCAQYAADLISHQPVAVIGYAATLDVFARHTVEFRSRFHALGLRFVLSTAEPPPRSDTLERVEDLFGCPVVEEYGGAEFGQVAFRKANSFDTIHDLNYLEAIPDTTSTDGSEAVVVTTLYPRYVPLIRYRVGDAVAAVERWPHGHVHRFGRVAGRENDVIALAGGYFVHSVSFLHCVRTEPAVHAVQLVVTDDGIDLCIVSSSTDRAALEQRIRRRLTDVHPSLEGVRFRYVDDLQTSGAGKRRWFIDRRSRPSEAFRV